MRIFSWYEPRDFEFIWNLKHELFSNSNNPIVLGPDNANLPKIFTIIADGVANESIKGEDGCSKRLANVIRQVQVSLCYLVAFMFVFDFWVRLCCLIVSF